MHIKYFATVDGDELDAVIKKVRNTHEDEGLTSAEVEALIDYVDMMIVEWLSGPGLAIRLKSPVQRNFCIKSIKKEKKQPDTKQTKGDFRQLSGLKPMFQVESQKVRQ